MVPLNTKTGGESSITTIPRNFKKRVYFGIVSIIDPMHFLLRRKERQNVRGHIMNCYTGMREWKEFLALGT